MKACMLVLLLRLSRIKTRRPCLLRMLWISKQK